MEDQDPYILRSTDTGAPPVMNVFLALEGKSESEIKEYVVAFNSLYKKDKVVFLCSLIELLYNFGLFTVQFQPGVIDIDQIHSTRKRMEFQDLEPLVHSAKRKENIEIFLIKLFNLGIRAEFVFDAGLMSRVCKVIKRLLETYFETSRIGILIAIKHIMTQLVTFECYMRIGTTEFHRRVRGVVQGGWDRLARYNRRDFFTQDTTSDQIRSTVKFDLQESINVLSHLLHEHLRDRSGSVRFLCLEFLHSSITTQLYQTSYMDHDVLVLVGKALHDRYMKIRLIAMKIFLKVLKNTPERMKSFMLEMQDWEGNRVVVLKLIVMSLDESPATVCVAIEILTLLERHFPRTLTRRQNNAVYKLMYGENRKVACAAGLFVHLNLIKESETTDDYICRLIGIHERCNAPEKSLCQVVNALFEHSAPMLDWKGYLYLLLSTSDDSRRAKVESVIELFYYAMARVTRSEALPRNGRQLTKGQIYSFVKRFTLIYNDFYDDICTVHATNAMVICFGARLLQFLPKVPPKMSEKAIRSLTNLLFNCSVEDAVIDCAKMLDHLLKKHDDPAIVSEVRSRISCAIDRFGRTVNAARRMTDERQMAEDVVKQISIDCSAMSIIMNKDFNLPFEHEVNNKIDEHLQVVDNCFGISELLPIQLQSRLAVVSHLYLKALIFESTNNMAFFPRVLNYVKRLVPHLAALLEHEDVVDTHSVFEALLHQVSVLAKHFESEKIELNKRVKEIVSYLEKMLISEPNGKKAIDMVVHHVSHEVNNGILPDKFLRYILWNVLFLIKTECGVLYIKHFSEMMGTIKDDKPIADVICHILAEQYEEIKSMPEETWKRFGKMVGCIAYLLKACVPQEPERIVKMFGLIVNGLLERANGRNVCGKYIILVAQFLYRLAKNDQLKLLDSLKTNATLNAFCLTTRT